jgi:DNA polymerase-4
MVGRRLRAAGRRGRVVSVGIVYRPDTGRLSRQSTLPQPVLTGDEIYRAASELLAARDAARDVGTLGVAVSGLTEPDTGQTEPVAGPTGPVAGQTELFAERDRPPSERPRNERLELAMDAIRDRFGEDAVQRARLLGRARVVRDRIAFGNTGHPDEREPG